MFTGIIKNQTKVTKYQEKDGILTLSFSTFKNLKLERGKSLNINGICSTVKNFNKSELSIDYMPETREKTTVNGWKKDATVNIEESVKASTFLDGHIVQGHIDARGVVEKVTKKGNSKTIEIKVPKSSIKFITPKGSVALDGVSLTVAGTKANSFSVALIPYSLEHTNLGKLKKGDEVNIETDLLARYLYKIVKSK